jgi:hypothetical protein
MDECAIFGVVVSSKEKYFSSWFEDPSSKEKEIAGVTESTILAIKTLVEKKHER